MKNWRAWIAIVAAWLAAGSALAEDKDQEVKLSPLDRYIQEALAKGARQQAPPGSLYSPAAILGDVGRDLRASQVDDIVTIVVNDRASAVSSGSTNTSRSSAADASVGSLFGPVKTAGLADLAKLGGEQSLSGQGATSRSTSLTTTLTARVTHVLPNGYLVVEGTKDTWINSERQIVSIRGVIRWNDLDGGNRVSSDRLADLEVRVNGRGVVNDAIRRPNFIYRLLLGLLPF